MAGRNFKKGSRIRSEIIKDFFEIGIAFLIAFFVYQVIMILTGTSVPVVSIASGSMLPKLHPGDLVFAVGPDNLKVGDIVIYRPDCSQMPDKDIIHRIIGFEDGDLIVKGDNNPYKDPCNVPVRNVKGKVVLAVPLLGWPRLLLNYIVNF